MAGRTRFSRKPRFGRFRRKRRNLWLPVLGQEFAAGEDSYWQTAINFTSNQVDRFRSFGPQQEVFPIVPDFTIQQSAASGDRGSSLHDRVSGNEWMLDSIVGDLHIHAVDPVDEELSGWNYLQVACAFFVARSEEGSDGSPDLFSDEFDPLQVDNAQNPWIWRRTWILSNPAGQGILRDDFPISNTRYDAERGTQVKTKTKRRIRREHRIWFTYSVIGWDGVVNANSGTPESQPQLSGCLDVRIAGRLLTNPKGESSF